MKYTPEINALFTLIDDPDVEVYETVTEKIVGYGQDIIPNLEHLWENTVCVDVQDRIGQIIHQLNYAVLYNELISWRDSSDNNLLNGALLVAKYEYPNLQMGNILQDIEKIRRNVWLELNNFLTPLEQANVLSSMMYNYYNLRGNEVNYSSKDDFFLNKVLDYKKGNAISNGIFYQIMCELLDINAKVINIPKHFLLAYYHSDCQSSSNSSFEQKKIQFYVDGTNGQAYAHLDIENYLKKMKAPPKPGYFKPLSHKKMIRILLEELSNCYDSPYDLYKQNEILALADILR